MGTQTDITCLDGRDVVALDGNLLVAGRVVIDDGLPVLAVLRELNGVAVNLVDARFGACVAVVDDEAVDAVSALSIEHHLVVGRDVAPLRGGLRGIGHAVDYLAGHLGGVRRAAEADYRLALQDIVNGVLCGLIGKDVEGLGGIDRRAHLVRGGYGQADFAFYARLDRDGLVGQSARCKLNAFGESPFIAGGVTGALSRHRHLFARQDIALGGDGIRYPWSRRSGIADLQFAGRLLGAVLHDGHDEHRDGCVRAVAFEARDVEALVAGLSDECLRPVHRLRIDVEVVEVLVPVVFPSDADVAAFLAEDACRAEFANLDSRRCVIDGQHSHLADVHPEVCRCGSRLHVECQHVDGLAVEGREVEVANGPAVHGRGLAAKRHVGLHGTFRREHGLQVEAAR